MYDRLLPPQEESSFFLFGPRGTGKTTWLKAQYPEALYFDLLQAEVFNDFAAAPNRLADRIPKDWKHWIILDEVQRVPALLHEVHRLIEAHDFRFILTGSSARKLKRKEVNLLAGRALTAYCYPLTSGELQGDFQLKHALRFGALPLTFRRKDPAQYLESYVTTYLREEIQQEGLTRNLGAFSRFLEAASLTQGQLLNVSAVARECAVHRKVVEQYFCILEDLLLAERIPVFSKKAKRRLVRHAKFYFFDAGVYRTIRPTGPLDSAADIDGAALETVVYQELRALNHYGGHGYGIYFWRTVSGHEVDFILYGKRGMIAIEVKRSARVTSTAYNGLRQFCSEYPMARCFVLYGGTRRYHDAGIEIIPAHEFFPLIEEVLRAGGVITDR